MKKALSMSFKETLKKRNMRNYLGLKTKTNANEYSLLKKRTS